MAINWGAGASSGCPVAACALVVVGVVGRDVLLAAAAAALPLKLHPIRQGAPVRIDETSL